MSLGQARASQAEAILSQISGGGAAAAAHLLQGQLPFNGQGYHGLHGLPTATSLMPLSAEAQPVVPPVPLGAQPQHAAATARSPPSEPMDAEPAASSSSLAAELQNIGLVETLLEEFVTEQGLDIESFIGLVERSGSESREQLLKAVDGMTDFEAFLGMMRDIKDRSKQDALASEFDQAVAVSS